MIKNIREIAISPAPGMEVHIQVSDQMKRDFRRCAELAAESGDGPDCNACSWRNLVLSNGCQEIAACTLPEIKKVLEETMNRITHKKPDGRWGFKNISWDEIDQRLYGALWKLKDYEDTGLSPEEVERLKEAYEEDRRAT